MGTPTRHAVATVGELEAKGKLIVQVKGIEIGLFSVKGKLYAWRNLCPHAAAPVCEGIVCGTRLESNVYEYIYGREDEILRCPWHGWEFDLTTGRHLVDDAVRLRGYEVAAEDGQIYITL